MRQHGDRGASLALDDRSEQFGVDLFQPWRVLEGAAADELGADAVGFELRGRGRVLRKVYRHEPGFRGLRIELSLTADGAGEAAGGPLTLHRRGPSLVNPTAEHVLGQNPAFLIGETSLGDGAQEIRVQRPSERAELPVASRAGVV